MDVRYDDDDLHRLEIDPDAKSGRFSAQIVRQFRRLMNLIRAVPHEAELRKYPSRNFEKLKGNRSHQWSLRMNSQWRLIVEIEENGPRNCLVIKEIADYH